MTERTDLLDAVIAALEDRMGNLRAIAAESGVPYDTVLRIKNREGQPAYGKVRALADALGIRAAIKAPKGAS
ncbi:MAG: hypothetical protein ACO3GP_09020 [Candidatus Limnocylindrus sp.]